MSRRSVSVVYSFGGSSFVLPRYSVGSLISSTADAEVQHFVRRRRSSAVGVAQ